MVRRVELLIYCGRDEARARPEPSVVLLRDNPKSCAGDVWGSDEDDGLGWRMGEEMGSSSSGETQERSRLISQATMMKGIFACSCGDGDYEKPVVSISLADPDREYRSSVMFRIVRSSDPLKGIPQRYRKNPDLRCRCCFCCARRS